MKVTISAIILAYNERLHIRRCVENVRRVAQEVFVVDCYSTDGTQEIARACGATVVEHDWPGNQAEQLNWALENLPITGEWVLRQDADEYLTEALIAELQARLDELPSNAYEGWGAVVSEALEEGMGVIATAESGAGATILPSTHLFPCGDITSLPTLLHKEFPLVSIGDWTAKKATAYILAEDEIR